MVQGRQLVDLLYALLGVASPGGRSAHPSASLRSNKGGFGISGMRRKMDRVVSSLRGEGPEFEECDLHTWSSSAIQSSHSVYITDLDVPFGIEFFGQSLG